MKKLFAVILTVLMLCTLTVSVSAAPGSFIESPSFNKTPNMIDFGSTDSAWSGQMYITSYGDRNTLDLAERELLEAAYDSIRNANSVSSIIPEITDVASNLNISADNLGISDLFFIGITESSNGKFNIKLDADSLNDFVGLIYYENGKWYLVDDAKINENGQLEFSSELPRAYAVVVDVDNSVPDTPITGDILPWVLVAVMAACAVGIVAVIISYKKKSNI